MLCSPCVLAISFNSLTKKCTFYFLTSIYPTYVSTYFGHHQGYTDIVTSLFTHSLGINVEHYAVYSNWQSPIAKNTITVSSSFELSRYMYIYIYIVLEVRNTEQ
jgi:hypothetical protein